VMHREQEDVLFVFQPHQSDSQERPSFQIERRLSLFVD
jgi:hypothetical protein